MATSNNRGCGILEVQKRLPWLWLFWWNLDSSISADSVHNQQWEAAAVVIGKIRHTLRASPGGVTGVVTGLVTRCNKWCSVWLKLIIELTGSKQ